MTSTGSFQPKPFCDWRRREEHGWTNKVDGEGFAYSQPHCQGQRWKLSSAAVLCSNPQKPRLNVHIRNHREPLVITSTTEISVRILGISKVVKWTESMECRMGACRIPGGIFSLVLEATTPKYQRKRSVEWEGCKYMSQAADWVYKMAPENFPFPLQKGTQHWSCGAEKWWDGSRKDKMKYDVGNRKVGK